VPGGAGPKPSKKPTSGTATPQHPERIWEQEAFIPEFLYDSMKENKRFDLMRVSSVRRLQCHAFTQLEILIAGTPRRR
jgi:hypothetical protein